MTFTRMKNLLQTIRAAFLLILLIGSALTATAFDFESGGIYYNITSSSSMTAAVTYYSKTDNTYSGTITIPEKVTHDGKTYYVTAIGDYAFVGCTGLNKVNYASQRITSIGNYAFQGCNGMTTFVVPSHITSIGNYAFNGCYGMTSVVIEESEETLSLGYNYSAGSQSGGRGMFYDCPLTSVFIGRPLSYSTTYNGYSPFANNKTLTKAHFGNPVTSIQNYLFYGCTSLKTLVYNSQCKPTTIGNYAFSGCKALTESDIHYPVSVKTIGDGAFQNCITISSYTIPDHITSVGTYAFQNCTNLSNVVVKPSVTSIGNGTFNGCTALTGITIEESEETLSLGCNYSAGSQSGGRGLFYDCPLTSVFIGRPLSYSTTYNGYSPFANNKTLTKAHFGNPVTSIQNYLFYGCTSLSTIVYNSQCKPKSIGTYSFYDCRSLTWDALKLPQSVNSIGEYAFQNCKFTSVVIKPHITSISNYAFNGCESMTNVVIEESEETLSLGYNYSAGSQSGGRGLFYDCPLTSVFIGRPLSYSTTYNGYSPFANNKTLIKARLGKKLASIPNYLFYGCTYLDEVTSCAATPPTANANCFANYNATLYVPKGSVNSYRNAAVWKDFYSIIGIDIVDDKPGDVDGNSKVNIDDVTSLINYLLSGNTNGINTTNADVDGNGRINIDDVTALIQKLLSGN